MGCHRVLGFSKKPAAGNIAPQRCIRRCHPKFDGTRVYVDQTDMGYKQHLKQHDNLFFVSQKPWDTSTKIQNAMGTWGENHEPAHIFPPAPTFPSSLAVFCRCSRPATRRRQTSGPLASWLMPCSLTSSPTERKSGTRTAGRSFCQLQKTTSSYITTKNTIDDGSDSGNRPLLWPPDSG